MLTMERRVKWTNRIDDLTIGQLDCPQTRISYFFGKTLEMTVFMTVFFEVFFNMRLIRHLKHNYNIFTFKLLLWKSNLTFFTSCGGASRTIWTIVFNNSFHISETELSWTELNGGQLYRSLCKLSPFVKHKLWPC